MTDTVTHSQRKWDLRFLRLAKEVSTWSKDPSTKVGAVLVRPNKTIASIGFNGLPQDMPDSAEILENVEERHACTIHAEMNAVLFAHEPVDGYTLYNYPVLPCDRCAVILIQKRIKRVVALKTVATKNITQKAYDRARRRMTECGLVVMEYVELDAL